MFVDGPATDPELVRHGDVLEWLAHPEEDGRRASHAVPGEDGLWLLDPLDVPGLDDHVAELCDDAGVDDVAGVAVLANYHARDAGEIAVRYDVPVHVPESFGRVAERLDDRADVVRFEERLGDSGFDLQVLHPLPGWREVLLRRGNDLYGPDLFGTAPGYTVGDERLGLYALRRPFPPRDAVGHLAPERIFVGHGRAVTEDATAALEDALSGARWRFPRALVTQVPGQVRAIVEAALD